MQMRHVLHNRKARKSIARKSVGNVGRNRAYNLDAVRRGRKQHRSSADAINSDAINEVCMPALLKRTNAPRKEALRMADHPRIPNPTNLGSNRQDVVDWQEWYRRLWQLKISRLGQDNG